MTIQLSSRRFSRLLIFIFISLIVAVNIFGYFYYKSQIEHLRKDKQTDLLSLVQLKAAQIEAWHKERAGDATTIFENSFIYSHIQALINNPHSSNEKKRLLRWMKSFQSNYNYSNVVLMATDGSVLLSVNPNDIELGAVEKGLVFKSLEKKQIVFSDLYRSGDDKIHLDISVPIVRSNETDSIPIGVMVLLMSPEDFLYPVTQFQPVRSSSEETLLFRREGDKAICLNELRHLKDTALGLPLSLGTFVPDAAISAPNWQGSFTGVDYRGAPVLAAMKSIPNTSWFILSKIDQNEVYAPARNRLWNLAMFVGLFIIAAGSGVGLVWSWQSTAFYRSQYQLEMEKRMLARHFEYLTKYANDIILLFDENQKIVDANERAVLSYGYTKEELLKMFQSNLMTSEEISKLGVNCPIRQLAGSQDSGIVFETENLKKDGTAFSVEVSTRVIEIEGKKYCQSIIRDISERKRAERELKVSYERLKQLTAHLQEVREDERTNIAREIHDELGQTLTALKIDLSLITTKLRNNNVDEIIVKQLNSDLDLIDGTVQSVKRICMSLRPTLLDHLGLQAAIEWQVQEFQRRTDIHCLLIFNLDDKTLNNHISTAIFRIIQEALTNVMRHSAATMVTISVREADCRAILEVQDNGTGISEESIAKTKSFGLIGIQERVKSLGGTFEIGCSQGEGALLKISIPIQSTR